MQPIVKEIHYKAANQIFSLFANDKGSIFFDSADLNNECAQFSYIAIEPFLIFQSKNNLVTVDDKIVLGNPFAILSSLLNQYRMEIISDLPPFQGGAAGFFSYEAAQYIENIAFAKKDDLSFPTILLGFYDLIISFDHLKKKSWIIASSDKANKRLDSLMQLILQEDLMDNEKSSQKSDKTPLISNFNKEEYCNAVNKVVEYILNGDIFQANISQRFTKKLPDNFNAFNLYKKLREINPAPFAAFVHFPPFTVLSASPERFIQLNQNKVETRPIKGTSARLKDFDEDKKAMHDLLVSEKDRAENIMIADLMRNDLSKVCEDHSVQVSKLAGLETYATVHHLVSVIHGQLKNNYDAMNLLQATFPGGSITGAPKIRAMEVIAEIEPTERGPYCGSIGYLGFNGCMDTSITIRTYCIANDILTFQVGGGIVLDSNPLKEYDETLIKANALIKTLNL